MMRDQRNIVPLQSSRITAAIEGFMMKLYRLLKELAVGHCPEHFRAPEGES